ncbi:MAG: calcium-translocating P-type ATPase, PMCA-type [Bacteroidales bacterium]|nr:calcium-translocating P-type ATPase, PMCA-type [Bacteroidales bacterium]
MSQPQRYNGLTEAEVLASRSQHGINVLTPPAKEPIWKAFLHKFTDPIIIILLVAWALSVGIACFEYAHEQSLTVFLEPAGILVAVLLATGLAFYFELQAEKEFAILNQVNDDEAVKVIRDGRHFEIPKKDVVVGDIVRIGTGDDIPADGELLEATTMGVDESSLTGEPICHKTVVPEEIEVEAKEATFPPNHVMRGTKVMEGHGLMRVFAVGDATENGKVFEAARIDQSVKTPLNEQLEGLGSLISRLSYVLAAVIVIGKTAIYLMTHDVASLELVPFLADFLQSVMLAVTLIVVSVPEGLPMAVTLSLAYSMRSMLRTNNLVRKMHACETMGATTVICTDKTGTLTQNQMRIHETSFYALPEQKLGDDVLSTLITEGIAVNSTATLDLTEPEKPTVLGNPTEGALILWLRSLGIDYEALRGGAVREDELPFTTERKYMATVVRSATGKRIVYVKGAPEYVFALCREAHAGRTKAEIDEQLLGYQNKAMRTLGFAYQELAEGEEPFADGRVVANGLTFLGVVAIADPVRAEVPQAVTECLEAGIRVVIVTGDTTNTAKEIARQIGLWSPETDTERNITTGPEFAALSDDELRACIRDLKIIARARPMDKKRLVETLQELGDVVAVTGDGTNDAPALKAAHVGLSMGDGTSVAKEASDITIVDNSFTSIGRAVMWGRSLYLNIQRFILFQLTVNVTACLTVLVGAFLGQKSPITVTQMLWVNLIMDTFAAMALASLPPSASVMRDKPRDRQAFIITKPMSAQIIGIGVLFFALLIVLVQFFKGTPIGAGEAYASLYELLVVQGCPFAGGGCPFAGRGEMSVYEGSLFFTIFVMMQFWNLFNARAFATSKSAFHFKGSRGFVLVLFIILLGQVFIVSVGGQLFSVTPLAWQDWLIAAVFTSPVLLVGEVVRLVRKPR